MTQFHLNRYFSMASGIASVIMTLLFAFAYHRSEVREHTELAGRRSDVLARTFANVIWPEFGAELTHTDGMDAQALRAWPLTARLHVKLKAVGANIPIIKIKIYNLQGIAVYSSVPADIGEDKSQNIGFLAARHGARVNGLTHRGQISATEGVIREVDGVESYVPVRPNAAGSIEAVFELYTDVTETVADIELPGEYSLLYIEDNPANVMRMEAVAARITRAPLLSAHNAELGIERALMERPETVATPVMALSANAAPRDIARGLQAGFICYETKPIDVEKLIATRHEILGKKEAPS